MEKCIAKTERDKNSQNAALNAVKYYANEVYNVSEHDTPEQRLEALENRESLLDKAQRVRDFINIYAGNILPAEAKDATVLYCATKDADMSLESSRTVAMTLFEYYTAPGLHESSTEYVAGLLNDMEFMDGYVKAYQETDDYQLLKSGEYDISTTTLPPHKIETMLEVAQQVNIEAIIGKSCMVVDNLVSAINDILEGKDVPDDEVLDDLIEAETFYGPLCEVFGLDGLAMELRSQALKLRMMKRGLIENILQIQEYSSAMREAGPQAMLREIAGCDDFAISSAINEPEYLRDQKIPYRSVQLGEFAIDIDGMLCVGNWRLKSVGSLANKIHNSKHDNGLPMDVMAFTFICDDEEALAKVFQKVTGKVSGNNNLKKQAAPSKEDWAYVQGDDDFKTKIAGQMDEEFIDNNVQINPEDKRYRVAKFTCMVEGVQMPVEIQFVTKQDRKDARIGESAHIFHTYAKDGVFYSAEERTKAADGLARLYERKRHMIEAHGELDVNPNSRVRGLIDLNRQKPHVEAAMV